MITNNQNDYILDAEEAKIITTSKKYFEINGSTTIEHEGNTFWAYLKVNRRSIKTSVTVDSQFRITNYKCNTRKPLGYKYHYIITFCYHLREHLTNNPNFNCSNEDFYNFDSGIIELIEIMNQLNAKIYTELEEELSNDNFSEKLYDVANEYFISSTGNPTGAIELVANSLANSQHHKALPALVNLYFQAEKLTTIYPNFNDQLVETMVNIPLSIKQLCTSVDFIRQLPIINQTLDLLSNFNSTNHSDLFFDLVEAIKPLVTTNAKKRKIIDLLDKKKNYFTKRLNDKTTDLYRSEIQTNYNRVIALYN